MKDFEKIENEKMINYCLECGAEVELDDKVCPKCQADLSMSMKEVQVDLSDYKLYFGKSKKTITRHFCKKCGNELTSDVQTCAWCGEDEIETLEAPIPAGFWVRVAASLIDSLVFLPIAVLGNYNLTSIKSLILMIVLTVSNFLYKPLMESHYGATLGKMLLGIKVIGENSLKISVARAYLRFSPVLLTLVIGLISNIYIFCLPTFVQADSIQEISQLRGQMVSLYYISNIAEIFALIDVLVVARTRDKRAIHDYIAGTYCVYK